jgi:hypothetical protein
VGIDYAFTKLKEAHKKEVELKRKEASLKMKKELAEATPVDTGYAKSRWKVDHSSEGDVIKNDASYVEDLNNGSSRQAPSHFIETIALRYGRPQGVVVEKSQSPID